MNFFRALCRIISGVARLVMWAAAAGVAFGQSASDLYRISDGVSGAVSAFHQLSVSKGGEAVLARLQGPGKVTYFYITDDTVGRWYPGLVLKVFWDDATEPSICVPLADFFGAVAGRTVDYQSAVMQIDHVYFICYLRCHPKAPGSFWRTMVTVTICDAAFERSTLRRNNRAL